MTQPELRACWYRPYIKPEPKGRILGKWTAGKFHQWGMEPNEDDGGGTFSVGIVEDNETGAVETVTPQRVHFGPKPEE